MKRILVAFTTSALLAQAVMAEAIPQKYVDQFGTMALAATGSQLCSGIELNQGAFQKQGESIRATAQADGMTDTQIDDMMKSLEANPNILMGSMMAFGEKHNVTPNDTDGFCAAMVTERQQGSGVGKLLQ